MRRSPPAAVQRSGCPPLRVQRSAAFRAKMLRANLLWLRAHSALAAGSTAAHLRAAQRAALALRHLVVPGTGPISDGIRAAVAARRGDHVTARQLFSAAAQAFENSEMRVHAAAARRRLGELIGGDEGRQLVTTADAFVASLRVVRPERLIVLRAPALR